MTQYASSAPWRRRLILIGAIALGALASAFLRTGLFGSAPAYAQAPAAVPAVPPAPDAPVPPAKPAKAKPSKVQASDGTIVAPGPASASAKPGASASATGSKDGTASSASDAKPAAAASDDADDGDDADSAPPTPRKKHHGATVGITVDDDDRVHVSGMGDADGRYDSFESFTRNAPWLAAVVFLALTLTFMVPLAIIALLIWYKVRKNRMLNETMLKLAEKGVMPPADAMAAIGAGATPANATPATTTLYDQARTLQAQRTWSDLRKGIILGAVGMGSQAYSLFDGAEANWLGLTLMFLGAGYIVLWYFEDRQRSIDPQRGGNGA